MKIKLYKIILLILSISLFSSTVLAVDYVTLEPGLWSCLYSTDANCVNNDSGSVISTTDLGDFLNKVFNFGIAVAVALSIIMISVGGVQYMTTDSWNKKEEGKERIKNALYGLALALVSWLILFTINPCLVTFTGTTPDGTQCFNTIIGN